MVLLWVGVGGFLGACARYLLNQLFHALSISLPLGTLLANVLAGFLIGFIIGWEQQTVALSPKTKAFLVPGLLGGLSTFSAFSLETVQLFMAQKYFWGLANIGLNILLSFGGVLLGMLLAKRLVAGNIN